MPVVDSFAWPQAGHFVYQPSENAHNLEAILHINQCFVETLCNPRVSRYVEQVLAILSLVVHIYFLLDMHSK